MIEMIKKIEYDLAYDFIKMQMVECESKPYFNFNVFVKDKDTLSTVANTCEFIRKLFLDKEYFRVIYKENEYSINYTNGSIMKILIPNVDSRGIKSHAFLIDKNIDKAVKQLCVYNTLVPYISAPELLYEESSLYTKALEINININENERI